MEQLSLDHPKIGIFEFLGIFFQLLTSRISLKTGVRSLE